MIFGFLKSHFISMVIFAAIVSTMLAFLRFDKKKDILRYGLRIFIYMTCGVIVVSWIMHFL
jgi:hypothetical protein